MYSILYYIKTLFTIYYTTYMCSILYYMYTIYMVFDTHCNLVYTLHRYILFWNMWLFCIKAVFVIFSLGINIFFISIYLDVNSVSFPPPIPSTNVQSRVDPPWAPENYLEKGNIFAEVCYWKAILQTIFYSFIIKIA